MGEVSIKPATLRLLKGHADHRALLPHKCGLERTADLWFNKNPRAISKGSASATGLDPFPASKHYDEFLWMELSRRTKLSLKTLINDACQEIVNQSHPLPLQNPKVVKIYINV